LMVMYSLVTTLVKKFKAIVPRSLRPNGQMK